MTRKLHAIEDLFDRMRAVEREHSALKDVFEHAHCRLRDDFNEKIHKLRERLNAYETRTERLESLPTNQPDDGK